MRKGEDKGAHVVADVRLLKRFANFTPKVNLETGMAKTIEYYSQFLQKAK